MNSSSSPHSSSVVTTQNISTVIRPRSNNNSLQFVKIQTPELSKTAVEQIKIAEDSKISKEKIKEVEEEWQNNLLNWKSKRRQHFSHSETKSNYLHENNDTNSGRKIKTFAEMVEQRAKSGNRLGFHLQRYIGADDDSEIDPLEENGDNKVFDNNQETLGKRLDSSDCEVLSSTSSGYVQPDSKSPSSPDIQPESQKITEYMKPSGPHALKCDIITSEIHHEQSGVNRLGSISIVENGEHDQINSTLRADVIPPAYNCSNLSYPKLGPTSKTDEILTRQSDSDNSTFEDDEEQEEDEERHLQRIAFVNKLKAFENLTKPTTKAQRVLPLSRPNKLIPKPDLTNKKASVDSVTNDCNHNRIVSPNNHYSHPTMNQQPFLEIVKSNQSESSSTSSVTNSSPDIKSEGSLGDAAMNGDRAHCTMVSQPQQTRDIISSTQKQTIIGMVPKNLTKIDINSSLSSPNSQLNHLDPQVLSIEASTRDVRTDSLQALSGQMTNLNLKPLSSPRTQVRENSRIVLTPPSRLAKDSTDSISPGSEYRDNNTRVTNTIDEMPIAKSLQKRLPPQYRSTHKGVESAQSPMSIAPKSSVENSPNRSPMVRGHDPAQMGDDHIVTKPAALMDSNLKKSSSTKKPIAQGDKDRTVLSVSGKRRCSSCKEELGRGAAAFVVESLNLVYHTNCFRCSVCHVNLSNGFRGVDVRVHAGALHCQNCYSKDGLNYSRV